jgi:hypothetical protein
MFSSQFLTLRYVNPICSERVAKLATIKKQTPEITTKRNNFTQISKLFQNLANDITKSQKEQYLNDYYTALYESSPSSSNAIDILGKGIVANFDTLRKSILGVK